MKPPFDLIIINYTLDSNNQLLSHQLDVVNALSTKFKHILVITSSVGSAKLPSNVEVIDLHWRQNRPFSNLVNFYRKIFPVIRDNKKVPIFSHMTQIQSMLIGPFTVLFGNKHVLWYAHKHFPMSLRIATLFVSEIVTSTLGSCPIKGQKVVAIGQAIDDSKFIPKPFCMKFNKLIHVGRLDKSKNIDMLIEAANEFRILGYPVSLEFIGEVAARDSVLWLHELKRNTKQYVDTGWLKFHSSIPRAQISKKLSEYDVFIHAYTGSLDKTLLEATLVELPVVTINEEYTKIFGSWSKSSDLTLKTEYEALIRMDSTKIKNEIIRRRNLAKSEHSFSSWIDKLSIIIRQN